MRSRDSHSVRVGSACESDSPIGTRAHSSDAARGRSGFARGALFEPRKSARQHPLSIRVARFSNSSYSIAPDPSTSASSNILRSAVDDTGSPQ